MPYDFPMDIDRRVKAHLATGGAQNEDELIRHALDAFDQQLEDLNSIRRGMEDEASGRVASAATVVAAIEQKFHIPSQA